MRSLYGITVAVIWLVQSTAIQAAGRPEDPGSQGRGREFRNPRIERALEQRRQRGVGRTVAPTGRPIRPETATGRADRLGSGDVSRAPGRNLFSRSRFERRTRRESDHDRVGRGFDRRSPDRATDDRIGRPDRDEDPDDDERPDFSRHEGRGLGLGLRGSANTAERLLSKRLAVIDHLRDVALRNGNVVLLNRADELEELARRQFTMRTEGTKLNWGERQRSANGSLPDDETPDADDPTEEDPILDDPVEDDPVLDDPVLDDPTEEDPILDDPVEDDPILDDPTEEDPVVDDPVEDDPILDDPTEEDPVVGDPILEDPTNSELDSDEPLEPELE